MEGAPSPAARVRDSLPRGSVSAGHGAAAMWTGTGWPVVWGDVSSLGGSVTAGCGGPGVDRSHQGGTLSAEGATAAGMGETGCPDITTGRVGWSCCGVLLSGGVVMARGQTSCLGRVMAAGTGETVFSERVAAGGTGKMGCPEGTTAGGTGRSCCGEVCPPCRASLGEGGGEVGGGMLSPIGDGGFPATQAEQNGRSLSGGAWGSPVPPDTALGGHPHCPTPGTRRRVHNAQRDRLGLCQAPPPQSHPSSPGSCHPSSAMVGTQGQGPHTGTGTHACPRHSPWRVRGCFHQCWRQDGRGPRSLTSPRQPMSL